MTSWVKSAAKSDFSVHNFPFGVFRHAHQLPKIGSAIGDFVVDLNVLQAANFFHDLDLPPQIFQNSTLNAFIKLGKTTTNAVRERLKAIYTEGSIFDFAEKKNQANRALVPMREAEMLLPITIGDYTDFYSSREHATNVGAMFRDAAHALLPNWLHLPVGYHGRASSIVVSGTPIRRPKGQILPPSGMPPPIFGATERLDFELEVAFVVGKDSALGEPIRIAAAEDHIFGLVLFNDWSARDIQQWEYAPLGPFLGKNFASSMSPWVVTLEALETFRVASPPQELDVLPYLKTEGLRTFDINLEVTFLSKNIDNQIVTRSNFKYLYWNIAQQLAHHTINGCNVKIGDLMASGTISGATADSFGSMLELTWRGTKPISMLDNSTRQFINDDDEIILRGFSETENGEIRVGFGECRGVILPVF